ncbi:root initiation defective 3-like protein [Tanacetum coccineum]|uniref:Root initiation defective 3-like protein n=1 Tax=Tanacetum coccineum TaxID=301880 RepID=A0ABQ5F5J2_9ASTR
MKEALVVCGSKNLTVGVTIWDIETGDHLLHIPTCASPFQGITCLRDQYLVATQIHHLGSVAVEAIEHLTSTKDGIYLAGGATSGNVYLWEVINGKLLKTWHAHNSPLTCLAFSNDSSLLISGSEDGMIVVWPMIGLLDETNVLYSHTPLSVSTDHKSFITGLLPSSIVSCSVFVSSSLDGTCKVWDLVNGTLLQTLSFPQPITAAVLDPAERFLFSGSADGRIFMSPFDSGLMKKSCVDSMDVKIELSGHKEPITALTFSRSGLISASEDCTACLWDVVKGVIIRRFYHHKGIKQLEIMLVNDFIRAQDDPSKDTVILLSSPKEQVTHLYQSANLLNQQIHDLEVGRTPEALQLKVKTNIENRLWIIDMTKRVMEMNDHLQSRLLDLNQHRISLEETEAKRNKDI